MATPINRKAFVLIDVLVTIAILGLLVAIAIPMYRHSLEKTYAKACLAERETANRMVLLYCSENASTPLTNLAQLVSAGTIKVLPRCPEGGEYILIPGDENSGYPTVGCSLHYWPAAVAPTATPTPTPTPTPDPIPTPTPTPTPTPPLTSLGSSCQEISGAMAALIKKFYDEKGKYPRSFGNYVYTDIGLDPAEWKNAVNGIYYGPGGSRVKITPEDGYTFYVTGADGKEKILKSSYNWSLWYSVPDGKWYYHAITAGNEIDISTLRVEKATGE